MKAEDQSIEFLKRNSVEYSIPFFQRGYVWDDENWEQLYESLISDDEANFLGAIILKEGKYINDVMHKSVIDGQQRMTTLTILARAINDEFYYPNEDTIIPSMENIMFNVDEVDTEGGVEHRTTIKIIHSRKDIEDYKNVIQGVYKKMDLNTIINDKTISNIIRCYAYFRTKIKQTLLEGHKNKITNNLIKKMTLENRKSLVLITLGDTDNEQVIFDTINRAGVKLTSADIIKNALFNAYVLALNDSSTGKIKAGKFYDESWAKTFENDNELSSLWNEVRTIGRSNERTKIELFLQAFAIIKGIYDPNNKDHKLEKLAELFKNCIDEKNSEQIKEFINELCSYADTYKTYFIDETLKISKYGCLYKDKEKDDAENMIVQTLQILDFLNTATFECYVLKIIKECSKDEIVSKLGQLNCYLIRNYIFNGRADKNFNKEAALLTTGKYSVEHYLQENNLYDENIKQTFETKIENNPAKLVLFWIELYKNYYNNSDKKFVRIVCNYQLEHVMPQKWAENWGIVVPNSKEDGTSFSDEEKVRLKQELEAKRNSCIYKLGNMTLLTGTKNDQLSNVAFDLKLNGYKSKRGIYISGLKSSSKLLITNDIIDKTKWDEECINNRTSHLSDEFFKIWPFKNAPSKS